MDHAQHPQGFRFRDPFWYQNLWVMKPMDLGNHHPPTLNGAACGFCGSQNVHLKQKQNKTLFFQVSRETKSRVGLLVFSLKWPF